MGQGMLRVSAPLLLEIIADTIDLDVLRRRLLLPEQYSLKSLSVHRRDYGSPDAVISLSSPEIPDNSNLHLIYQSEPGEEITLSQRTETLLRVEASGQ